MAKIEGKYEQFWTERLLEQINSEDSITKRHHLISRYLYQRDKQIEKIIANIEDDDIDLSMVIEQLWEDLQLAHKQILYTMVRSDFYAKYHKLDKWDAEKKELKKIELMFKVGDKIRKKTPSSFDRDMQVARIEKDYYVCNHIGKFSSEVVPFSKESSYELIEHNPAETENGAKGNEMEFPNSAWSEEDEKMIKNIIYDLDYLKKECCNDHYEGSRDRNPYHYSELINWLKSLKDRIQPKQEWKPSDEQMESLNRAQAELCSTEYNKPICDLIDSLNKLREE